MSDGRPAVCPAHGSKCSFISRPDGWSYWKCPEGCWLDIYMPGEKRP